MDNLRYVLEGSVRRNEDRVASTRSSSMLRARPDVIPECLIAPQARCRCCAARWRSIEMELKAA
jgi:hypothetical protein